MKRFLFPILDDLIDAQFGDIFFSEFVFCYDYYHRSRGECEVGSHRTNALFEWGWLIMLFGFSNNLHIHMSNDSNISSNHEQIE